MRAFLFPTNGYVLDLNHGRNPAYLVRVETNNAQEGKAMKAALKLSHTNVLANAWAFYAADTMVRIDAIMANEERQMRECMSNRDNYDIEGIRSVIAYNESLGWTRRADIARAILAERLAEVEPQAIDIAFADESQREEILRIEKRNSFAATMRQLIGLRDQFDKAGEGALRDQAVGLINAFSAKIIRDRDAAAEAKLESELDAWLGEQEAADWDREQAHVRRAENGGHDIYAGLPDEDGRHRYDRAE